MGLHTGVTQTLHAINIFHKVYVSGSLLGREPSVFAFRQVLLYQYRCIFSLVGPHKCQLFFWGSIPLDPKLDPHSQPCYAVCDSVHCPQAYRILYLTLGNIYNMDTLFYIGSSKIMTQPAEQALFVRKRQALSKRRAFPCGACLKPLTLRLLLLTCKNTNKQLLCLFCRLIMTALGSKNAQRYFGVFSLSPTPPTKSLEREAMLQLFTL